VGVILPPVGHRRVNVFRRTFGNLIKIRIIIYIYFNIHAYRLCAGEPKIIILMITTTPLTTTLTAET